MKENRVKPIRWGIIGCGDVTEKKSGPAYQQTEGFELIAVMRRNHEKAEDYARRHGVAKYYDEADALIRDPEVDAVYIATPPDSHMHYALKVAEAGKPCCIEKPMARNYQECLQVFNAFEQRGIPLFIAYYRRTLPRFLKIKSWLDDKTIGSVRHINWTLHQAPTGLDLSKEYNWRTDIRIAPGGYFDDLASHGIDLFCYLLDEIAVASGVKSNLQELYSAPDAIAGTWLHKSGVSGAGSWNFGAGDLDRAEIFGSEGKISFSVFHDNPIVLETKNEMTELYIDHPDPIQLPHVEGMKRALFDNNYKHPSSGNSAMHTSWVMDRILNN